MRILILIPALLVSAAAFAADCKSVEGHIGKRAITAERVAVLQGNTLQLSGTIDGSQMPHQNMDCIAFATGVMCERRAGTAIITVTTNGKQLLETIKDMNNGQERASITYDCGQAFTLKR